jgi:hypothetical protein
VAIPLRRELTTLSWHLIAIYISTDGEQFVLVTNAIAT